MAHSATTIDENGICWQYAVARRVVQRSPTLLALESPWMSLTRDALWHNGMSPPREGRAREGDSPYRRVLDDLTPTGLLREGHFTPSKVAP